MKFAEPHQSLVVFDWDGTLIDSIPKIVTCMQAAANFLKVPMRSDDDIRRIVGLGLLEAVHVLWPELAATDQVRVVETYKSLYPGLDVERRPLFDQAMELLVHLKEQGFCLAVATGKSRIGLDRVWSQHLGVSDFFSSSRCADETQSKPHPQMLLEIMQEMRIAPEATVMIGDSVYDLQMAARANVPSIGVASGAHQHAELILEKPLACFQHLGEVKDFFSRR